MVVSSCAPGLLSLGLTFGFVQSSVVPADLSHAPHSLDTVHHLQQEGDYLQTHISKKVLKQMLFGLTVSYLKNI